MFKVINITLEQIYNNYIAENPQPLLQANHSFDYMAFGNAFGSRVSGLVHFQPGLDSAIYVNSDSVIPITGNEVYFLPSYFNVLNNASNLKESAFGLGQDIEKGARETIFQFLFYSNEHAAAFRGNSVRLGDRVAVYSADRSKINDDNPYILCDSDDCVALAGLPLFFKISLAGGGPATGTDFPLELRLREWGADETGNGHQRTYVFPGDGLASIVLPVYCNRIWSPAAAATRWRLEVYDPTGTTKSTNTHLIAELICGYAQEYSRYTAAFKKAASLGGASPEFVGSFCFTADKGAPSYHVSNNGNVSLNVADDAYIPSLNDNAGAGYTFGLAANAVAAGAVEQIALADGARHRLFRISYPVAASSGTFSFSSTGSVG